MVDYPFTIREALESDLPTIIDLAVEMVVHSVSPYRPVEDDRVRQFRRRDLDCLERAFFKPHVGIHVAEAGQAIIGHVIVFAGQQDSSTGEQQAWIFDLAVQRDWWGSGVGQALMAQAEEFARQAGVARLGLGVTLANQRALAFYGQLGYQQERVQMVKNL